MKKAILWAILPALVLTSCGLTPQVITKEDLLRNIRLCDNSYVGLLGFLHIEGKVENNNRFGVRDVELKAILYNKETRATSYQNLKVCVPITAYGSASYAQKIYVGTREQVQRVEVTSAQRY